MKTTLLYFLLFCAACSSTPIDLPGFDEAKWQQEKSMRIQMLPSLREVKGQLKGMDQDKIISVLGMPDKNELYKRNQKFFIYHISDTVSLNVRFNATGLAKEVLIIE